MTRRSSRPGTKGKDGLYSLRAARRRGPSRWCPTQRGLHRAAAERPPAAARSRRRWPGRGVRRYLELRADALLTDDYQPSDMAWMDMKTTASSWSSGPIETYEDQLFGYRAAFEAFVLSRTWSGASGWRASPPSCRNCSAGCRCPRPTSREPGQRRRPERLRRRLLRRRRERRLQDHRHQPAQRRAGAAREGHAPPAAQERDARQVRPDPGAHRRRADRRGQRATSPSTRSSEHHVPRGGPRPRHQEHAGRRAPCARPAREHASALEEGKADVLGLYMVTALHEGRDGGGRAPGHYVTFLAGIFRSCGSAPASAHGRPT
jgi:hypothetical protein